MNILLLVAAPLAGGEEEEGVEEDSDNDSIDNLRVPERAGEGAGESIAGVLCLSLNPHPLIERMIYI